MNSKRWSLKQLHFKNKPLTEPQLWDTCNICGERSRVVKSRRNGTPTRASPCTADTRFHAWNVRRGSLCARARSMWHRKRLQREANPTQTSCSSIFDSNSVQRGEHFQHCLLHALNSFQKRSEQTFDFCSQDSYGVIAEVLMRTNTAITIHPLLMWNVNILIESNKILRCFISWCIDNYAAVYGISIR